VIFPCLNELIQVSKDSSDHLFALNVLTDYLKFYGEPIFQMVSRQRRLAIDADYEVMIPPSQRYQFLTPTQTQKLRDYFLEQFKNRWLTYSEEKFGKVKTF